MFARSRHLLLRQPAHPSPFCRTTRLWIRRFEFLHGGEAPRAEGGNEEELKDTADEAGRVDVWTFALKDPASGFDDEEWANFSADDAETGSDHDG
jgi:hypothetical protein